MQQIHLAVVNLVLDALPFSTVAFPDCMLALTRTARGMRTFLVVRAVASTAVATLSALGSSRQSPIHLVILNPSFLKKMMFIEGLSRVCVERALRSVSLDKNIER